jgi:flagellar basal-body rod protein FlgG
MRSTASPLDVALEGKGFFAVDAPSGVSYTRSGSFRLSSAGQLVTADGYPVRTSAGGRFQLTSNPPPEILPDGTVRQNGQTIGQLAVVDFDDPQALSKQGNTYFSASANVKPRAGSAQVHQGKLEASNVGSAETAVRLISVMRHFEMLQRAVTIGGEMNKKALDEVARVG